MFQVAATIGLSLKYNIPYCIPKHTLNDEVWKPYHFENVNYCNDTESVSTAQVWKEPSHAYHEIPRPEHRRFIIDGYVQSYKYFDNYLPEIRKAFGFDNLETNIGWCSIHIRRGDYLLYKTKHPVVTNEYLQAAQVKMMNEGIYNFKVFSDDIEYCKNNIPQFNLCEYIFITPSRSELSDFKLMARCEHNIIANSTYSWWGAYLNNNPNKIVITPDESNWFGIDNKKLDVSDLIPKKWIRIKY